MRILIIGAGVTGSLFASCLANGRAKLEKAFKQNVELKLLARGDRLSSIEAHGLKINHVLQKLITIDNVPVISRLESGDRYDFVLVFVRKSQIDSLLPLIGSNKSDYFLFVGNNGTGIDHLKKVLTPDRIGLGFAITGGRREGDTVFSVHAARPSIIMGPAGQDRKRRLSRLARGLRAAGISPRICRPMDSWLKYRIALMSPIARAHFMDGGDNISLAGNTELLKICVKAIKEGFLSLKSLNYPVRPFKLRLLPLLPDLFIRHKLRKFLSSERKGQLLIDQCMAAPDEMSTIAEEFDRIIEKSDRDKTNLHRLV